MGISLPILPGLYRKTICLLCLCPLDFAPYASNFATEITVMKKMSAGICLKLKRLMFHNEALGNYLFTGLNRYGRQPE
jgi:hypothetical protein